jgi:hypothetical protein
MKDQIREDLATYSPAIDWFTITLDEDLQRASVDLMGLFSTSATYRPGIGCTLDQTDMSLLDNLKPPFVPAVDESRLWPVGPRVAEADSRLVDALTRSLAEDQQQGLQTRALVMVLDGQIVAEAYAAGSYPEYAIDGLVSGQKPNLLDAGLVAKTGVDSGFREQSLCAVGR